MQQSYRKNIWVKPLGLSIWAAEKISIKSISQAAISSLGVKAHVVFEQLDLDFKYQEIWVVW